MQNAIININGQILHPDQAKISVFDRSYLYGDSLYEVARTYGGNFFGLREHLERLEKSAALCRMVLGQKLSEYEEQIHHTLAAFYRENSRDTEAYCRIVVSRGEGKIGFGLSCLTTPTLYTIIIQPVEEPSAAQLSKGYRMQISKRLRNDPRALDPAMKSGNYLNSLLAYLDAATDGCDDALLCNHDGFLTEGTTFNLFYIRRGIVATPPLDIGILDGITRREVIKYCRERKIEVREVRFTPKNLMEADEVFLTSSIKEVFPITRIDGKGIGNGKPGKLTMQLREGFHDHIRRVVRGETGTGQNYAREHS